MCPNWTQIFSIMMISYGANRGYLHCLMAYDIMPVGKNDKSAHDARKTKTPEADTSGVFLQAKNRTV